MSVQRNVDVSGNIGELYASNFEITIPTAGDIVDETEIKTFYSFIFKTYENSWTNTEDTPSDLFRIDSDSSPNVLQTKDISGNWNSIISAKDATTDIAFDNDTEDLRAPTDPIQYKYLHIRWMAIDKTGLAIINNQLGYHMKNGHEMTTQQWNDIRDLLEKDASNDGVKNNIIWKLSLIHI